jgi:exodeoxyribonuclease V alpha subunit
MKPELCGVEYSKDSIALCAPTGKASQRMKQSTGWDAYTIHRLLGLYVSEEDNDADETTLGTGTIQDKRVVIVDEASMIDTVLMGELMASLPTGCKLIIVGDADQLPSIGPGCVFKDIITSSMLPVARLTNVYRQSEGSRIFDNARAVINGNYDNFALTGDDFTFINTALGQFETEYEHVIEAVRHLFETGLDPFDFLVLAPMYKGDVGVNALNIGIQEVWNPGGDLVYSGRSLIYRVGDKVLQVVNNYDKNVYNGDVGRIISYNEFDKRFPPLYDEKGRELTDVDDIMNHPNVASTDLAAATIRKAMIANPVILIDFGDNHIEPYLTSEMSEITLAYAMSVHKAQGSEARCVVQVASTTQSWMLYRQLFYTGMTRARKHLYIVGTEAALMRATRNIGNVNRRTNLKQILNDEVYKILNSEIYQDLQRIKEEEENAVLRDSERDGAFMGRGDTGSENEYQGFFENNPDEGFSRTESVSVAHA